MFTSISNKASEVLSPMPNKIIDKKGEFTFSQDTIVFVEPQFSSEAETFSYRKIRFSIWKILLMEGNAR